MAYNYRYDFWKIEGEEKLIYKITNKNRKIEGLLC
jgi:hypothetical protein